MSIRGRNLRKVFLRTFGSRKTFSTTPGQEAPGEEGHHQFPATGQNMEPIGRASNPDVERTTERKEAGIPDPHISDIWDGSR
jgi:hypothetical protein